MKKTTVTLLAQTILTMDAGTHEAVRDGGNLYLLIQQEDGGEAPTTGTTVKAEPKGGENIEEKPMAEPAAPASPNKVAAAVAAKPATEGSNYTEAELNKLGTDEILEILEGMGIDPTEFEGRNTHKKLRLLVLDGQAGKLEPAVEEAEVVDDTAAAAPAPTTRKRGAAKAPAAPRKLTEDEIEALEDGDMVMVKLDMGEDAEDPDKLWEAEVIGWKVPDGGRVEKLHVKFQEDGQEDYLRDEDEVFEYTIPV